MKTKTVKMIVNREKKITKVKYLKALKRSGGIKQEIAQRLGVTRKAVYDFLNKYPDMAEALQDEKDTLLDVTENLIIESIVNKKNVRDAKWWLERQGKGRGFSTRQEITGKEGEPTTIIISSKVRRPQKDGSIVERDVYDKKFYESDKVLR